MIIYLNNQAQTLDADFTLIDILRQEGLHDKKGLAIAINNEVIPKTTWQQHTLHHSDKITLITATQGG